MKRSLVVGGTQGIGRAVVRLFMREGHRVTVIGRNRPQHPQRGVRYCTVDLCDQAGLSAALQRTGRLDNLVFCQRFRGEGDAWLGEFQTSLTATKDVIEHCHGVTSIVIITSSAARWIVSEQPIGYHAMKAALVQMVRYLAVTLGPRGCRVNCVSPGTVCKAESADFYRRNKRLTRLLARLTPLGRMAKSEDVANVVAFLCSERAAFVTGQELVVDGGVSLQGQEALTRRLMGLKR